MEYNKLVLLVFFAAMALTCQAFCPVRLPQDEPSAWFFRTSPCKDARKHGQNIRRARFPIRKPTPDMPYARLNMNQAQYVLHLATNPFLSQHSNLWISQAAKVKSIQALYSLGHKGQHMTMEDFAAMRKFFRNHISSPLNLLRGYMRYPSSSEPFQSDFTKWISDQFFAEQRLAGINPLTIQKITLSNKIGMHFNSLKEVLNPNFNLVEAVKKVLSQVTDENSLKKAIEDGHLFVLYHPLANGLKSMPDLTDKDRKRKMWEFKSPITIFASKTDDAALAPVAIQMDAEKEAPVYTPQDGDDWMLAKLNVQLADFSYSQIVEHLDKVHFTVEAVCLSIARTLDERHPLQDMIRFHCRGVLTLNTFGGPVLLHDKNDLDHVLEYGNEGAHILTKKAANIITWHDLDLKNNLKRRGVDDMKRLPYYPFRDDGLVIYDILEKFVIDYINAFYSSDSRVEQDYEVQNFVREVSKDGHGAIRGFPASIKTKASLMKTFTRILWLVVGQHASVNYPLSDYVSYIPNIPSKLYDVEDVPRDTFSAARLGSRNSAVAQLGLINTLASFRMDRLFDYGRHLKTSQAKKLVHYYKHKLDVDIEPELVKRNRDRLEQGHLTYPYMQPSWLTNGIQS